MLWFPCPPRSDPNLHFVEQVALAPPEVQIDLQQQQEYEKQLQVGGATSGLAGQLRLWCWRVVPRAERLFPPWRSLWFVQAAQAVELQGGDAAQCLFSLPRVPLF